MNVFPLKLSATKYCNIPEAPRLVKACIRLTVFYNQDENTTKGNKTDTQLPVSLALYASVIRYKLCLPLSALNKKTKCTINL